MEIKIEEISYKLLCNACLSVGNKLYEILDQKLLIYYVNALREIPLFSTMSSKLHLCFDCRALMCKAISFKEQVKDSHRILQAYTSENLNECLISDVSRPPRLKVCFNEAISLTPEPEYKDPDTEAVLVKEELKIDWERDYEDPIDDSLHSDQDVLNIDNLKTKVKKTKKNKKNTEKVRNKKVRKRKVKDETIEAREQDNNIQIIDISYEDMLQERDADMLSESYKNAEFKCENCVVTFKYYSSYRMHLESKHSMDIGDYMCPICKVVVTSVHSLATHHKRHTRRYECKICHKRMSDLKTTQQHVQSAHQVAMKEYKCNECGKISKSIDTHRYHKDTHKARLQCAKCDKSFRHRAALMNHRVAVHEYHNEFPCTLCEKVFRWKNSLKRHLAEKHEGKNKMDTNSPHCDLCDITFSSIFSYNRHMSNSLRHVTPEQLRFICDHCKKRFADKTKLRDHIEEKHLNKTYQCHLCLKPSKNRVGLDQHIRNVHKGRPNNKICHHCGKGFPTRLQLESHIRTHTGERPFICEFCPTTFSQQSNLYKHNRQVHLNMKAKSYPIAKKKEESAHQEQMLDPHNVHDMNFQYYFTAQLKDGSFTAG